METRIKRSTVWVQAAGLRACGSGDLGARRKAGVKHTGRSKHVRGRPVDVEMLGLNEHRLFPHDAEPAEVLENSGDELWPRTGDVDVLDT